MANEKQQMSNGMLHCPICACVPCIYIYMFMCLSIAFCHVMPLKSLMHWSVCFTNTFATHNAQNPTKWVNFDNGCFRRPTFQLEHKNKPHEAKKISYILYYGPPQSVWWKKLAQRDCTSYQVIYWQLSIFHRYWWIYCMSNGNLNMNAHKKEIHTHTQTKIAAHKHWRKVKICDWNANKRRETNEESMRLHTWSFMTN